MSIWDHIIPPSFEIPLSTIFQNTFVVKVDLFSSFFSLSMTRIKCFLLSDQWRSLFDKIMIDKLQNFLKSEWICLKKIWWRGVVSSIGWKVIRMPILSFVQTIFALSLPSLCLAYSLRWVITKQYSTPFLH